MKNESGSPAHLYAKLAEMRSRIAELERQEQTRRQMEDRLRQGEERYDSLYNRTPVMLHSLDTSGRLVSVSDHWLEVLGYERPEVIGRMVTDFMTDTSSRFAHTCSLKKFFRTGICQDIPYQLVTRQGKIIDVLLSATAEKDGQGRIVRSLSVMIDVTVLRQAERELTRYRNQLEAMVGERTRELKEAATWLKQENLERKRIECALRESEEKYRRLFESESDAVMICDAGTLRVEDANQAALNLFGYTKDEILTLKVTETSAEPDKTVNLVNDLAGGRHGPPQPILRYYKKKDGTVFPGEVTNGMYVSEGRAKVIGAIRDITRRIAAEEFLRESEEFSSNLLNLSPNPIIVINSDRSVRYVNPSFENLTGFTAVEAIGLKPPYPWWPKELIPQISSEFETGLGPGIDKVDFLFMTRNRQRLWVEITSRPFRHQGRLKYYVSSWVDMTERKKAEERLRESEEKWRSLVESAPDIIATLDRDGTIIFINRGVNPDIPRHELVGRNIYRLFPSEYINTFARCIEHVFSTGKSAVCETKVRSGNETYWYSHHFGALWREGQVAAVTAITADVTARKKSEQELGIYRNHLEDLVKNRTAELERANHKLQMEIAERARIEKELRESEERFRYLSESTFESIFLAGGGVFVETNMAACDMFGYTREEIIGMTETDIIAPESRELVQNRMASNRTHPFEAMALGKERRGFPVEIQAKNMPYKGTVIRVIEIRDITDRKKWEDELLLYQQSLRRMGSELSLAEERERRRIATDLHDHIGQSLAIFKIRMKTFRQTALAPEVVSFLDEMTLSLDKMIQETRSLTMQISPPLLYDLGLEAALEWLSEEIQQNHDIRTMFINKACPITTDINMRVVLFRSTRELLLNVVKHSRASQAKVILRTEGGRIKIEVVDDGIGFNASAAGEPASIGEGFGLFSIRERLNSLGGGMGILSTPGQGTNVVLTLPLKLEEDGLTSTSG